MNKSTGILLGIVGLLLGIVTGFLLAPIKKGVTIGSYNDGCGCDNDINGDKKKDDEEYELGL